MKKLNHIFLMLACLMLLGSCSKKMETVTVHTAEEFIKALKPDTHIIIDADGDLDINQAVRNSELPIYNQDNPQKGVFKRDWDETFYICLDNIIIEGTPDKSRAHFLSYNETVDVLVFRNCKNVTLKHIMAGHNQTGDCLGDVIDVENCNNITIDNCELYGCGVTGVSANSSKNIAITNCWIYECSQYGIWLNDAENVTISNSKIEFCRNASSIEENCKNVVFTDCTTENNNEQSYEMNVVAKMMKMSGDQPFEGPDPEDLEDSQEPEYLTGYTDEVEYHAVEGADVNESELETITVHTAEDFVNAIGSNRKIIVETDEWIYTKEDYTTLASVENLVIEGKGEGGTHFDLMFTEGSNNVVIRNITLCSIHIGSGCSAFTIDKWDNNSEVCPDYRLRINNAENILVKNSEIWNSPTIINKSTDIEFVGCDFNQCNRYMEANDISNVWFNACTFENSPGDGECDEYGHFKLDSPVVFLKCRLKVWQAYADFSMAKLIECPKCFADMEDWSDLYE